MTVDIKIILENEGKSVLSITLRTRSAGIKRDVKKVRIFIKHISPLCMFLFLLELLCAHFPFLLRPECGLRHRIRNSPSFLVSKLFKDKRKSGYFVEVFFIFFVMPYHYIHYLFRNREIYKVQHRTTLLILCLMCYYNIS